MVYGHNSGGQLFCNLLAKIDDEIWWDLLVSNSLLIFSYHFRYILTRRKDFKYLKSTNKGLYKTSIFDSIFDRITIKLGIISICLPTSFVMLHFADNFPREDDGKYITSRVGQMPKNLPRGQIISKI